MTDVLNAIPASERALIEAHTRLDSELFNAGLDLFW